jgi:enterochelin esterase-like enzyme
LRAELDHLKATLLAVVAALLTVGIAARAGAAGILVDYPAMKSAYIGSAHVTVWLPPDYAQSSNRYAVLYMQDGQNLFDLAPNRSTSLSGKVWGVDSAITALAGRIKPVFVVAVDHLGVERPRQYVPQTVFDRLPQSTQTMLLSQYGGAPFSDDYLRFLVKELKPFVDRTYRTDPDRRSTFVMGSSMGGLISLYAVAEYPDVFGGAACLSTHWPLAMPGSEPANPGDILPAFVGYLREKLPAGHRIWFDHGTEGVDASYAPYQRRIDDLLLSMGWRRGKEFESMNYVNASHDESAWRARLADPLLFLLGRDPERSRPGE